MPTRQLDSVCMMQHDCKRRPASSTTLSRMSSNMAKLLRDSYLMSDLASLKPKVRIARRTGRWARNGDELSVGPSTGPGRCLAMFPRA
jgi:hypothetical protein